ncbi:WD repeat-containing protein 31-like [Lineus longissimus]|uniref:WD repeat-containing protein 31-like n=1 Tax=Lineus longissimus TaxID=88925 RepID=UPI002B4C4C9B
MNYFRRMGRFFRKLGDQDGDERHSSSRQSAYHSQNSCQAYHNEIKEFPPVHTDAVSSLAAIQPGICLSGSKDHSVVLFDYNGGNTLQKWTGHQREITQVAYGQQSKNVFSASRDKSAKMWQRGHSEQVRSFEGHSLVVTALALNEDNTHLCTGSRDNTLKMWDVESGECLQQNNTSRNLVTHMKWGRGANILAQTSEDKELKIWDTRSLQISQTFPRKLYIQTSCDLSSDNLHCLTSSNGFGGNGCEATLWDLRTTTPVCEYRGHIETVASCIFLPSQGGMKLIATSANDCNVKVWNRDTKECLCSLSLSGAGPLTSLVAYEDNTILVSSFNLGVHVLSLQTDRNGSLSLVKTAQY